LATGRRNAKAKPDLPTRRRTGRKWCMSPEGLLMYFFTVGKSTRGRETFMNTEAVRTQAAITKNEKGGMS